MLESELSDDWSGYDEIYQQGQKERAAMLRDNIAQLREIETELEKT